MLINPALGPELFLGEIITTFPLRYDEPSNCYSRAEVSDEAHGADGWAARCRSCRKCIDACPTGALRPDGWFDASVCINYLTIEHPGEIPSELAAKIGDRLFGCDRCVVVCPYYRAAPVCSNPELKYHPDTAAMSLPRVLEMSEEQFNSSLGDSPLSRAGLDRLKRNATVCIANLGR